MELNPNRGERIAFALIASYLSDWAKAFLVEHPLDAIRYEEGDDSFGSEPYFTKQTLLDEHPEWREVHEPYTTLFLADKSGIKPGTIGRWLRDHNRGQRVTIGFFDADRLLAAIHRNNLWQTDPDLASIRSELEERPA